MGVLQRFERRIEELVNRPFARAFKSEVQPVEIAGALQRECDDRAAIVARGRTMVPNVFVVALGPHDHERLNPYAGPLGNELAAMVREHAEEQGYSFVGPVEVALELDEAQQTGRFLVRSEVRDDPMRPGQQSSPADKGDHGNQADPEPLLPPADPPAARTGPWLQAGSTTYPLGHAVTTIGRGPDADLRLDDPGVSRLHAELRVSGGAATMTDLGSTNGIVVDGRRVHTVHLYDGIELRLGSTTVVFHDPGSPLSSR